MPTETVAIAVLEPQGGHVDPAPCAAPMPEFAAPVAEHADQVAPDPAMTPLPRHKSLAKPRSRAMVILDRLFRGPFRRRPIEALPPIDQLRALRDDLVRVQTTIDRLLDRAAA